MKKILLVEDNPESQVLVKEILSGMSVDTTGTIKEAENMLLKTKYDLLVLDICLPDGDGLKFFSVVREQIRAPTLILSGSSDIGSKVMAFSLGVDDFIAKPFQPEELKARVLAKLKKLEEIKASTNFLSVGDLEINLECQRAFLLSKKGRKDINLTSKEFKLLAYMAKRKDWVVGRDKLLDELWGTGVHVSDRTVDTHISHLRKKFSKSNVQIDAVHGEGYRLSTKEEAQQRLL
jgi:DNA-binding response OmpR family regulator